MSSASKIVSKDTNKTAEISDVEFNDTLLNCLMYLVQYYDKKHTEDSLTSGLPLVESRLTPSLFIRAANRAGMNARIVEREAHKISPNTLPAVVLVNKNQAALLTQKGDDGTFTVDMCDGKKPKVYKSVDTFNKIYTGSIILTKPSLPHELAAEMFPTGQEWFWGTLKQFKPIYTQVVMAAVLINLFALTSPLFVMNVYDRVVPNAAFETLWVLASGIIVIYTFDFIFKQLRGYFIDIAGKGADIILAGRIFQQVMNVRLGQQGASSGAFANQVRDFDTLRDFFTSATMTTFIDLPFVFLFIAVIAMVSGPVALVPLIAVPIILFLSITLQKPVREAVHQAAQDMDAKHGHLIETITGLETIKSMNAQSKMQTKWEQGVGVVARLNMRTRFYAMLGTNSCAYITQLVTVFVVIFGVYRISNGDMSVGALIATTILTGRTLAPLGQAAALYGRYHQSKESLMNLNNIMQMEVERPAGKDFVHLPEVKGSIRFDNVSFAYPNTDLNSVNNLNFNINPGDKVAVIGRIGSGKSTIARLMLNLYNPTEGSVLIDGLEVRQLDPAELRRNISYVPQQLNLFRGTLRENIMVGNPRASHEDLLKAAEMSGVADFARRHPMGFDMPVGEQGAMLSGGQRQSVAVARAFINDAPIYLMDEPTSNMDNRSEQNMRRVFATELKDKTVVLITHKSSMMDVVDKIILVDYGKVVAAGPKKEVLELLSKGGIKGQA